MLQGVEANFDRLPGQALVDNGFTKLDAIEELHTTLPHPLPPSQPPDT